MDALAAASRSSAHGALPPALLAALSAPGGAGAEALEALDAFVHELFVLRLGADFFIQGVVALALIGGLILGGSSVILYRIYRQKFWLWKVTRRSEGIYIIPNSLNCFLIFEGAFGILWIAFSVVQYIAYGRRSDEAQGHLAVFNTVVWLPLWIGASLAGWGSFYTAPGALDRGPLSSSKVGRFLPRPLIVNLVCLGTPFLLAASVAAPMALAQRSLNSSFAAYRAFAADVQSAVAQAPLPSDAVSALVRQASGVWEQQVHAIDLQGITFTVWSVWAGLFLVFYIPAGGYLLYLVWQQMQRQGRIVREMEERQKDALPAEKPAAAGAANALQRPDSITVLSPSGDSLLFQPLNAAPNVVAPASRRGSTPSQHTGSPPVTPRTLVNPDTIEKGSLKCSSGKQDSDFFFPPLRPDLRKRATQRVTQAGTPTARYRYLRRCFINLLLLYVSITLGALAYLIIASVLGGRLSDCIRSGPDAMTRLVYGASCAASWVAVVFGTLSFASIFSRFFDPSHEDAQRTRTPFAAAARSGKTNSDMLSPHERTRPLPAVPESVGATMDAGMLSMGGGEERSTSDVLDGIKFQLRPDAQAPGTLLMRPVDGGAGGSADVSPESTQLGVAHVFRRGGRRQRRLQAERAAALDAAGTTSFPEEVSQTDSQRSFKAGRTVYYPTPYGHMPAPARGEVMPLPPERSPPPTAAGSAAPRSDDVQPIEELREYELPSPPPAVRGWVHEWGSASSSAAGARRASVAHHAPPRSPPPALAAYRRRPSAPLLCGAEMGSSIPAAAARRSSLPQRSPPPGGSLPLVPGAVLPPAAEAVEEAPRGTPPAPLLLDGSRRVEAARLSPGIFF